ncbi:hypothetical protein HDU93_009606 [Gonapodya sp. JEL0774]|nr:hypothetical protein HDU93_009606 [Gonapodya sp. JEL0774]
MKGESSTERCLLTDEPRLGTSLEIKTGSSVTASVSVRTRVAQIEARIREIRQQAETERVRAVREAGEKVARIRRWLEERAKDGQVRCTQTYVLDPKRSYAEGGPLATVQSASLRIGTKQRFALYPLTAEGIPMARSQADDIAAGLKVWIQDNGSGAIVARWQGAETTNITSTIKDKSQKTSNHGQSVQGSFVISSVAGSKASNESEGGTASLTVVEAPFDGGFHVTYKVETPGEYTLHVQFDGNEMAGFPHPIHVVRYSTEDEVPTAVDEVIDDAAESRDAATMSINKEWTKGDSKVKGDIDVCFLYIEEVKRHLQAMSEQLTKCAREWYTEARVRFAIVSYRDHDQNLQYDPTGIPDKNCLALQPFSHDVDTVLALLSRLQARGGDDFAEAVEDGLHMLADLNWNPIAAKCVIWVGDACAHGWVAQTRPPDDPLQSLKGMDFFPDGCPCGVKWEIPVERCRTMGVAIEACHILPLSTRLTALQKSLVDVNRAFFHNVADQTGGLYLPFNNAALLPAITMNHALAVLDMMRLQETVALVAISNREELESVALTPQERSRKVHVAIRELGYKIRKFLPHIDSLSGKHRGKWRLSFEDVTAEDVYAAATGMRSFVRMSVRRFLFLEKSDVWDGVEELERLFMAAVDILLS